MKRLLLAILLLLPILAFADTYQITAGWTDPTPPGTAYTPLYDVEYKVAAGAAIPVNDLPSPSYSNTVTATPGQTIEIRVRNKNSQGGLVSAWSVWAVATAQAQPTQPLDPTAITFTVVRTGP